MSKIIDSSKIRILGDKRTKQTRNSVWKKMPKSLGILVSNEGRIIRPIENSSLYEDVPISLDTKGYPKFNYKTDLGKWNTRKCHRVIAKLHVSGYRKGLQVNHKDGVKTNNHPSNFEWVTPKENSCHARDTGLQIPFRGEEHGMAKLTEKEVRFICKDMVCGLTNVEIASKHGIFRSLAWRIREGILWKEVSAKFPELVEYQKIRGRGR